MLYVMFRAMIVVHGLKQAGSICVMRAWTMDRQLLTRIRAWTRH